ncbi:MAG: YihY/virulence factor BrkB family protein, partial [Bdellovibrionales bacterium]
WGAEAARGQIVAQMTNMIGEQGAEAIQTILKTASENKDAGLIATIAGFGTLLFGASGVFGELQDAMNTIWKVPPSKDKAILVLLRDRFFSFTMVIGSAFLLLVSLVISTALAAVAEYASQLVTGVKTVMPIVDFLVSFGAITVLFALTFKVVPDTHVAWRCTFPAAVLTAALFVVGKMLIGLYLAQASVGSSYGAAGSVVVILVWIYYSSQILFFGAEFAHKYAEHYGHCEKA